mmetsp:Transcript_15025/g.30368  ORF Transcript_15025/g.30368 Transcript_15025/m.30368 type:complete len:143 (+) Transcript_15025:480-908(+)
MRKGCGFRNEKRKSAWPHTCEAKTSACLRGAGEDEEGCNVGQQKHDQAAGKRKKWIAGLVDGTTGERRTEEKERKPLSLQAEESKTKTVKESSREIELTKILIHLGSFPYCLRSKQTNKQTKKERKKEKKQTNLPSLGENTQ